MCQKYTYMYMEPLNYGHYWTLKCLQCVSYTKCTQLYDNPFQLQYATCWSCPQVPPYMREGLGIHCLHMCQVISIFLCRRLIQTRGNIYGVAKWSKYAVHTCVS